MATVLCLYALVYLFFYDYSYYHIDTVEEPMIRFLFLESMLLGAYFRSKSDESVVQKQKISGGLLSLFLLIFLYFGGKLAFSHFSVIAPIQFINQITVFVLLFYVVKLFYLWEQGRSRQEYRLKKLVTFISEMTLEIYLVQYIVYYIIPPIAFPLNFIIVTALILVFAVLANIIAKFISKKIIRILGV